jgi:cytochrome oxidase Cu insertion factor (SCO1/SenC/PrrC family)
LHDQRRVRAVTTAAGGAQGPGEAKLQARNERGDMDYPMHPDLKVGNTFPDFELPDQDGKSQKLSKLIRGFHTVLIFSRGYY